MVMLDAERATMATNSATAADAMEPMITAVLKGPPPIRFEFWDGSSFGPDTGPGTIRINSSDALRRIIWAPGELGFGRAFVTGDVDIDVAATFFKHVRQQHGHLVMRERIFDGIVQFVPCFRSRCPLEWLGDAFVPTRHGRAAQIANTSSQHIEQEETARDLPSAKIADAGAAPDMRGEFAFAVGDIFGGLFDSFQRDI